MTDFVSEISVTQPYAPGRCWYGKRSPADAPTMQRFCGKPAHEYMVQKLGNAAMTASQPVTMWLCWEHSQKMTKTGYIVTLLKG